MRKVFSLILLLVFVSCTNTTKTNKIATNIPQKGKLYSVHFGINNYSESAYGHRVNGLQSCNKDAYDMQALCGTISSNNVFVDNEATIGKFKSEVLRLASIATIGDTVVITDSGHGTYFSDQTGTEVDGQNEGTCLYDGILWDDNIKALLSHFKEGVVIITIWDTCHSGTGTRVPKNKTIPVGYFAKSLGFPDKDIRALHKKAEKVQPQEKNIKSTIVHLAAAKDNEYALDGPNNGNFTHHLKLVIDRRTKLGLDLNISKVLTDVLSEIQGQTPMIDKVHIAEKIIDNLNLPLDGQ